jgi:NitT/TauT family transport system ATP-binding protein
MTNQRTNHLTAQTAAMIEIKNVSKVFQLENRTIHALENANLSIAKGEFITLIGASGCGKSTLLRIIAGFERPSSGSASMLGKPITGPAPERGMVFQDYALFPWLRVRDNIGFGPVSRGLSKQAVKDVTDRFIDMVGLEKFADVYPHQLSGGMRQRVAIARVLANDAQIVLMDEPFGALDAMTRERLQQELLDIWKKTGLTVVFVTHAIEEAIFLADRVVVMSPGPGRIESNNPLTLPRPRDISSPEFNDIRRELSGRLHSHHGLKTTLTD